MNQNDFIRQIYQNTEKMTKKQLILLVNSLAAGVEETKRESFLAQVEAYRKGQIVPDGEMAEYLEAKRKQKTDKLDVKIQELMNELDMVNKGEYRILMDEYEDWSSWEGRMNDGWVVKYTQTDDVNGVLEDAVAVIHKCINLECYQKAVDVFERIKAVCISVESEYSGDMEEYGFTDLDYADFIDVDLHPLCRDVLNAAYHVTDAAELPQIFYEYYELKPFQRVKLSSVFSKKEWKEMQTFLSAFGKVIEENGRKEDWQKKLLAEIGELSCE